MPSEELKVDSNKQWVSGAVTNDASQFIRNLRVDPATGALIVQGAGASPSASTVDVNDRADRVLGHVVVDNVAHVIIDSSAILSITGSITGSVNVGNLPSQWDVSDRAARLLGHVNVDNFPSSFSVSNFPAAFSVNNFPASFAVSNFPASTAISNLPATYPLSPAEDALLADIKRAVTDYETRLDYSTRTDGNPVYVGKNLQGTATNAATWSIQKLDYDSSSRLTRAQVKTGSWDDRATLF